MHVDFKISTWERIEIPEGKESQVKKLIESGEIESANDLSEFLGGTSSERLMETDEQMTLEENGGYSTIEIHSGNLSITPIWKNGG